MWKWFLGIFIILVLLCGGGAALIATNQGARDWLKNLAPKPKPIEVRIDKVVKGTVTRTVNAPGSVEPKTKIQISAQIAARILALPFREGDTVKQNEVVVRLDAREYAAQLEQAQASQRAEESRQTGNMAAMKQAEADYKRITDLLASKDVPQSEMDQAEAAYLRAKSAVETSKNNIEVARAQITRAQKDLDNTTITSPINGRVVKLNAEVGELVLVGTLNNAASVIMEVADLNVMLMKARVDEANIAPIKAGQTCKVYINAFRDREFPATVERVGLKRLVDRDGTGYFEVEILVEKPGDLVLASGLTANVDIQVETLRDVLKLPSQAVVDRRIDELPKSVTNSPLIDQTKAFARVVYIIESGVAKAVPVAIGSSDLTHTVILGGIAEGAEVVTGPFKVLVDLKDDKAVMDEEVARQQRLKGDTADKKLSNNQEPDKGPAALMNESEAPAGSRPPPPGKK